MKRFLVFVVAFSLCILLAVPAFAAERQVYIFDYMPSVAMYDSSQFDFDLRNTFWFEGRLPEGVYDVTFVLGYVGEDEIIGYSVSPVCINYSSDFDSVDASISTVTFEVKLTDEIIVTDLYVLDMFDSSGVTACSLGFFQDSGFAPDEFSDDFYSYIIFTSVDSGFNLSDYLGVESLYGVLDNVVVLLPVVAFVLVGYLGLRKAIVWLQALLRGA